MPEGRICGSKNKSFDTFALKEIQATACSQGRL
jgi:hypothetical protein